MLNLTNKNKFKNNNKQFNRWITRRSFTHLIKINNNIHLLHN